MLFIDRFLNIAERYPDHTAIETDGQDVLTYATLKARSAALAYDLQHKHGITQGDLVAINVPKSADYITAMLALWMIGAAFLPLDPALPDERRDFIFTEAQPKYILRADDFQALADADFPCASYADAALAYVIFTSGSTGQPKGVMVSHAGLTNCLMAQIDTFCFTAQSRSLFYLSTNFDASISDIGTALLSGAALLIESKAAIDQAAELPALLNARRVTHMDIPPSLLRLMSPAQMPDSLDTIVIGGEACPPETVRQWAVQYNLVNVYGPTEATICTSMVACTAQSWARPLIGDPLPNVDYILVDDHDNMVHGEGTGELLIGGKQLALGYMNRPELTAQKFVMRDGRRFYRSGDLIRRHTNGDLEFLGRTDRQVKIRGQLVELEEVETKLSAHPSIARAAVLKRDIAGRGVLVAFVEYKHGKDISADMLKFWLRGALPNWMIPQYVMALAPLPKTATGKIDYAPLCDMPLQNDQAARAEPFANDVEEQLRILWQAVLKTPVQSAAQNFFTLGGDSLAVLELSLQAELAGLNLTTAAIADCPTIQAQAEWIAHHNSTPDTNIAAGGMTAEALRRDVAFDDTWQKRLNDAATLPKAKGKLQQIFFTGGTGFLGARLLYNLLSVLLDAEFTVLVRAQDEAAGLARLKAALAKHQLSYSDAMLARVKVVCGDFALNQFGLDDALWQALATEIDIVFHIGALVNTVAPYQALRAPNVAGTQEVIKFALSGQRKAVHYASTLSVFVSTDQNSSTVYEADRLEDTQYVYGGYGQSKWAAEKFLLNIPTDLLDISIYRLGLITGDTKQGLLADHDFLKMFIGGLNRLGSVPEGNHDAIEIDITPVDYAADIMADLFCNAAPNIYHIANNSGASLKMILDVLAANDQTLPIQPYAHWHQEMQKIKEGFTAADAASYLALCRLFAEKDYQHHRAMDLFQASNIIFDAQNTHANTSYLHDMQQRPLKDLISLYYKMAAAE